MTTIIFVILMISFFIAILNWLPAIGASNSFFAISIATMVGYMKSWDFLFPITELFICVAIVVAYEIVVWSWVVLNFVYVRIRGTTH